MKRIILIAYLSLASLLIYSQSSSNSKNFIKIIPQPQFVNLNYSNFTIDSSIRIVLKGNEHSKNLFAANLVKSNLAENFNINTKVVEKQQKESHTQIIIEQVDSSALHNNKYPRFNSEGYYLDVTKNTIHIKAYSPKGIFYGCMSLIQLLDKAEQTNKRYTIPTCGIVDWPDMKIRGISDDISRGQVSNMDNFKKIIRFISRYKMNTYLPYLEDMLEFDIYPSIGKNRGALSKKEVRELINYAKDYHVEIIPIFQTLGHFENILNQEEFVGFAEYPGASSLNVSSDSIYIFLENMLKEVFQLFPSAYFHMGADESYDVGLGKSREYAQSFTKKPEDKNSKNKKSKVINKKTTDGIAEIHAAHYKKVYDICKKYNKNVIMYSDIVLQYPKIINLLPKDIIMLDWHYHPLDDYKSAKIFNDAGFEYIVSPTAWNFFTHFPVNALALPNISYIIKSGANYDALGMVNSCWGDYGSETFRDLNFFPYAWSANCAWNNKSDNVSEFSLNFFYDFFGINATENFYIFQTLSEPYNQVPWHEIWRHPLLPFRDTPLWEGRRNITTKINWMNWTMPLISENISAMKTKAKRNNDYYDFLAYAVKLNEYFVLKTNTQIMINSYLKAKKDSIKDEIKLNKYIEILNLIDKNISTLTALQKEYKTLWNKNYKEDNLNFIMDKFNRLKSYFTEIKGDLINESVESPEIKSDWIYTKNDKDEFIPEAVFTKSFILKSVPDSALLHFMADNYAKLYINGQYIDKIFAKGTLSISVDYKRIKLIDITKYLKDSVNTIEVEAKGHSSQPKAGINIYAELYYPDTTQIKSNKKQIITLNIKTDETWQAKEPNDTKWKKVTAQKYSKIVIAPDLKKRRTGWVER